MTNLTGMIDAQAAWPDRDPHPAGRAVDIITITISTTLEKLHDHVWVDATTGDVTVTPCRHNAVSMPTAIVKKLDA